jgi:hypothetical protein
MDTMRWVALVALLFSACSDDDGVSTVDQAESNDVVQLTRETPSASITLQIPRNSLWSVHTLERTGCDGVPMPTRMQFSRYSNGRQVAFVVFSSGYSDEADWGMLDDGRLWIGERRINPRVALEASVWTQAADGAIRTTLHYYGDTECSAVVLATKETL